MTTNDKLIAILERAEQSARDALDQACCSGRGTISGYAEDAHEQVCKALEILRAQNAELEADIQKQAGAWGL